jgi:hypothetical protein
VSLIEYLYVDTPRLNSYLEQISPPIIYDKVPSWRVALGLNPSIEGTVEKHGRQLTSHEKITRLMKYLEKENLMFTWRLREADRWGDIRRHEEPKVFVIETCRATKIWIPPKPEVSTTFKGLTLWFSAKPLREYQSRAPKIPSETSTGNFPVGALYLLEDDPHSDSETIVSTSSYSALSMLLDGMSMGMGNEGIRENFEETVIAKALSENNGNKDFRTAFSTKPVQLLSKLGAKVGTSRIIRTLYRIRATLNDEDYEFEYPVVTIGYPIFIAEAEIQKG